VFEAAASPANAVHGERRAAAAEAAAVAAAASDEAKAQESRFAQRRKQRHLSVLNLFFKDLK